MNELEHESGPAHNLARQTGQIVQAASLHPCGEEVTTGLRCRRRPQRRKCPGFITVTRREDPREVEWRCSVCSGGGVVGGWKGGPHDLGGLVAEHASEGEDELTVRIPTAVYDALLDERALAIGSERLLYAARASAGQVELRGSVDEIDELYEESCADANHAPRGLFRKRLEAACELLRTALGAEVEQERATLEAEVERERVAKERAIVAEATHGLRLLPEELAGLRLMYREVGNFLAGFELGSGERIQKTLRETGESLLLGRKIQAVLDVKSVDYRHLSIFIGALRSTLERIDEFGARAPQSCLELYRVFLAGIGKIVDRVHVDENELADFAREVAEAAVELVRDSKLPPNSLRPLFAELVELLSVDECCTFHFVPELFVKLGLGKRERGWLRGAIERRLAEMDGRRATELEELRESLS